MAGRKKAKPRHDDGPTAEEVAAAKEPIVSPPAPPPSTRSLVLVAIGIALLHAFACTWIRNLGFDHISDDDFSRVVIAQGFAHSAKLDPSGTSWLPFPFWILGLGLKLIGRDLATAHGLSILFASVAAPLPWVALRLAGARAGRSFIALVFALGTPWAMWSGAATVPESFTATLTAAGVLGLGVVLKDAADAKAAPSMRAGAGFAAMLFAACLSRYEAWPAAAVAAIFLGRAIYRGIRGDAASKHTRVVLGVALVLCVAGPLLWMAWNAHAHDGPLHFFRRVAIYKRSIGEGSTSWVSALFLYPLLLFASRPEVFLPALVLSPLAIVDKAVRQRWGLPLLAVIAEVLFLSIGNARDGAPAHHAERALLGAWIILALYVADVILTPWVRVKDAQEVATPKAQKAFTGFIAVAWIVTMIRADGAMPGMHPSEDRTEQMQRGDKLRRDGTKPLTVTPCGYEHFALIAAYGAPEQVTVNPSRFSAECPKVESP